MNLAMDLIREALFGGSGGGGGGGGMTKVFEKTYEVSTTSTTATKVEDIPITREDNTWYYAIVESTGAPTAGYCYGSESFFKRMKYGNTTNSQSFIVSCRILSSMAPKYQTDTTAGYGVYVSVNNDGVISVWSKYSSSYSGTVDGTYKVTVYQMAEPVPMLPYEG